MLKKLTLIILFLTLTVSTSLEAYSNKKMDPNNPAQVRSTMLLKKYMSKFGIMVAGLEILRSKEADPDWEAIALTIQQMDKTLKEMRVADKEKNYEAFTKILESNLAEVKAYGSKKDKKVFDSFQKLTQTCFNCHAAHRPTDFLIPKKSDPRISGD